jgi:hypothetical protein
MPRGAPIKWGQFKELLPLHEHPNSTSSDLAILCTDCSLLLPNIQHLTTLSTTLFIFGSKRYGSNVCAHTDGGTGGVSSLLVFFQSSGAYELIPESPTCGPRTTRITSFGTSSRCNARLVEKFIPILLASTDMYVLHDQLGSPFETHLNSTRKTTT